MSEPNPSQSAQDSRTRVERLEELFDGLVSVCEDIVGKRTPLLDRDGLVVTDDDGRPYMSLPAASHLKVAASMLERLKIGAVPTTGSASGRLLDEARANGWKIGGEPVDESRLPADDVEAV